jgi:nucleoside 2-deoxyribosyltransferase
VPTAPPRRAGVCAAAAAGPLNDLAAPEGGSSSGGCPTVGRVASVYIASPFGFSAATKRFYTRELLEAIRAVGIEPLDPWDDPAAERELDDAHKMALDEERRETFRAINRRLGAANAANIERSDALLAVLDGVDVDSGTAAEVGFAAAIGKPIVGLRLDTRQAGDNEGAVVNMQVEHFIVASGGDLVGSIEDATDLLSRLLHGEPELPTVLPSSACPV